MKTAELQKSIIQKVLKTEDNQLLDYLNHLLNERTEEEPYLLSDFEKSIIAESQAEYQSGKMILNDLKSILHQRIATIYDPKTLSAMITFLETKPEETIYKTTIEQKAMILEGREQIAKGNFFTNEQVEKEIDQWLSKE